VKSPRPWRQEGSSRRSLDLHGRTRAEAERLVRDALAAAVRDGVRRLTVIHGKGTGALRERVNQLLRNDKRVKQFRLGAWNEGGAGVTVAEFS
jgi:DNA mismatch repair protein MutS2